MSVLFIYCLGFYVCDLAFGICHSLFIYLFDSTLTYGAPQQRTNNRTTKLYQQNINISPSFSECRGCCLTRLPRHGAGYVSAGVAPPTLTSNSGHATMSRTARSGGAAVATAHAARCVAADPAGRVPDPSRAQPWWSGWGQTQPPVQCDVAVDVCVAEEDARGETPAEGVAHMPPVRPIADEGAHATEECRDVR